MLKTLLKISLIVVAAAVLACGAGQCARDLNKCEAASTFAQAAVSDWKLCGTEVIIANTKQEAIYYSIVWKDHDIPDAEGKSVVRAGGALAASKFSNLSARSPFRLCPGRHTVVFYLMSEIRAGRMYGMYKFVVYPNTTQIVLTPDKGFYKRDYSIKPPKQEDC